MRARCNRLHAGPNNRIVREAKHRPCADCDQRYPYYVMQFDHLGEEEKEDRISALAWVPVGEARLRAEMAKCEVVCANCHAERTHQRRATEQLDKDHIGAWRNVVAQRSPKPKACRFESCRPCFPRLRPVGSAVEISTVDGMKPGVDHAPGDRARGRRKPVCFGSRKHPVRLRGARPCPPSSGR